MGFGVDMAKAREIHKTNIREAREPLLLALDVDFQKALETGTSTTDIVAKKQALRDAPADSGIPQFLGILLIAKNGNYSSKKRFYCY